MRTGKELLEALQNNREYWVKQAMKDFNIQEGTDAHKALLKATDGVIFSILVQSSPTEVIPIGQQQKFQLRSKQCGTGSAGVRMILE